jgi:hypothetical protein
VTQRFGRFERASAYTDHSIPIPVPFCAGAKIPLGDPPSQEAVNGLRRASDRCCCKATNRTSRCGVPPSCFRVLYTQPTAGTVSCGYCGDSGS